MIEWSVDIRVILSLLLATVLGGLIGWERERRVGLSGIRTHAAVALGACLFSFISFMTFGPISSTGVISGDPTRIAAQIVSGIGFLGAGVIIRDKGQVRGLTSAATIWATASVGVAVAAQMYIISIAATLILFALLSLYRIPGWSSRKELNRKRVAKKYMHQYVAKNTNDEEL